MTREEIQDEAVLKASDLVEQAATEALRILKKAKVEEAELVLEEMLHDQF